MIALYIILGIIALIVLILNIHVGARLTFSNDSAFVKLVFGFLQIPLFPKKEKVVNVKKVYKKIKNVKLSEYKVQEPEQKKKKKKSTADEFKDLLKNKDNISLIFHKVIELLKVYSVKFKKHFHINIYKMLLSLELGSPDKTCEALGIIYPSIAGILTLLDQSSKLKIKDAGNISVAPSFINGKTQYSIDLLFKVRIIVVLLPALKTALSILFNINQNQKGN